jgi:hypothetical protein
VCCQWYVSMSVTYLPMYTPSPEEMGNADVFASNVRAAMAAQANMELNQMTNADNMCARFSGKSVSAMT